MEEAGRCRVEYSVGAWGRREVGTQGLPKIKCVN